MNRRDVMAHAAHGFRYVLASQIVILVLGLTKAVLIPLLLSVTNYGYWQLYVFYATYAGIFGLGFNDGLYLRYGGHEPSDLPLATIRRSLQIYSLFLVVMSVSIAWLYSHTSDPDGRIVMYLVAANIVVMGLLAIFSQTLQATNQLKRFGFFNSADKVFFLLLLPPLVLFHFDSYLYLASADLASKMFVLGYFSVLHRELFIGPMVNFGAAMREVFENISAGAQLMIANVSGMLVLGTGRLVIEYFDRMDNYAIYAFGVSVTNLALVVITALSVVIYPTLKRLPRESYLGYFNSVNETLFVFNALMLFAYFPVVYFIEWALPDYAPVTPYLNLLFCVTALQAKMQLLNNTYYKVLRFEAAMLFANLSSLAIAIALSAVGYAYTQSIWSIAFAAFATMLYRVYASEFYLRKKMADERNRFIKLEMLVPITFLTMTSLFRIELVMPLSFAFLCCLLFVKRRKIKSLLELTVRGAK